MISIRCEHWEIGKSPESHLAILLATLFILGYFSYSIGFRWTDGGPVKYINWLTNRPYSGNRHFCAGMNVNGFWEDTRCYAKYPSICKIFKGKISDNDKPPF